MKIEYTLKGMPLLKQTLCIGDLLRYYGERKYKLLEDLEKIEHNKGLKIKVLNAIKEHTRAGMTIDQLMTGLQTAGAIDVFKFKVNGKDLCDAFEKTDMKLEVYMNPIYFSTAGVMSSILPGFRRVKRTPLEQAQHEQSNWIRWFEKNMNKDYHPFNKWTKKILEE